MPNSITYTKEELELKFRLIEKHVDLYYASVEELGGDLASIVSDILDEVNIIENADQYEPETEDAEEENPDNHFEVGGEE